MTGKEKTPDNEQAEEPVVYGNPEYTAKDDIYNNEQKTRFEEDGDDNTGIDETDNEGDLTGGDLDVPGAGLDDLDEAIGEEDEENNYYSLGGDNHNDLEESEDD